MENRTIPQNVAAGLGKEQATALEILLKNPEEFNKLIQAADGGNISARVTIQKVILAKNPSYAVNPQFSIFVENLYSMRNWKNIVQGLYSGKIRLEVRKFISQSRMEERIIDFTLSSEKVMPGVKAFEGGKLAKDAFITGIRLRKGTYTLASGEDWDVSADVKRERSRKVTWGAVDGLYENGWLNLSVNSDKKLTEFSCQDFNEANRTDKLQGLVSIADRAICVAESEEISLTYELSKDTLATMPTTLYFQAVIVTVCAVGV